MIRIERSDAPPTLADSMDTANQNEADSSAANHKRKIGATGRNQHVGFQRLSGSSNAVLAADLARLCEIDCQASVSVPAGPRTLAALDELDALGRELRWKPRQSLCYRVHDNLSDLLGLDQHSDQDRLRAIVRRVYASAERVAQDFANAREEAVEASRESSVVKSALSELMGDEPYFGEPSTPAHACEIRGPVARLLKALDHWQYCPSEVKRERAHVISRGLAYLAEAADAGEAIAQSEVQQGRIKQVPRQFFVLRLAELLSVSTWIDPQFTVNTKLNTAGQQYPQGEWVRFVLTVFKLVRLPASLDTLAYLFRTIKTDYPEHLEDIPIFDDFPTRAGRRLCLGDLPSEGIAIDWRSRKRTD
jgi:hypothetical protein